MLVIIGLVLFVSGSIGIGGLVSLFLIYLALRNHVVIINISKSILRTIWTGVKVVSLLFVVAVMVAIVL